MHKHGHVMASYLSQLPANKYFYDPCIYPTNRTLTDKPVYHAVTFSTTCNSLHWALPIDAAFNAPPTHPFIPVPIATRHSVLYARSYPDTSNLGMARPSGGDAHMREWMKVCRRACTERASASPDVASAGRKALSTHCSSFRNWPLHPTCIVITSLGHECYAG